MAGLGGILPAGEGQRAEELLSYLWLPGKAPAAPPQDVGGLWADACGLSLGLWRALFNGSHPSRTVRGEGPWSEGASLGSELPGDEWDRAALEGVLKDSESPGQKGRAADLLLSPSPLLLPT